MGKINNVLCSYLGDSERFADLFNGVYFQGAAVIRAEDLEEGSELYSERETENSAERQKPERTQRIRDIKKTLKTGGTLRLLALENQNLTDYVMPLRCMQYDSMEYRKQVDILRRKNRKESDCLTDAERMCGVKKTDRIIPVYTLCLYHGEARWDGPRSLRDMMDFGADEDQMSRFFADYPMRLFCVNEEADVSVFKTELRELFRILQFRSNRQELKKLMQQNPEYRHLDEETSEVVAAMLNAPEIWENRERYMNQEKEEFNMCRALQEWAEEERTEGRAEGIAEAREVGIRILIENCKELGASEKVAVRQVMKKYEVEEEAAEDYVKQHWK